VFAGIARGKASGHGPEARPMACRPGEPVRPRLARARPGGAALELGRQGRTGKVLAEADHPAAECLQTVIREVVARLGEHGALLDTDVVLDAGAQPFDLDVVLAVFLLHLVHLRVPALDRLLLLPGFPHRLPPPPRP